MERQPTRTAPPRQPTCRPPDRPGIGAGARERMKAIVFHEHGGPEVLRYEDFPDPICGPREVLVRVGAAALNGFEPMILAKTTALRTPLPMIPCGDAAGEVVSVGPEAESWREGDRGSLYPMVPGEGMTGETRLGTACELIRVPAA